jgi:flagellar biosynthesis/type III secretory pathway M-ring protein FliF/YscJ
MPTPEQIDAVGKIGAFGLVVLALVAMYTRRVRTASEANEDKAEADARLAEMRADRDAWKALATSGNEKIDRLTDAVNLLAGKLPGS